MSFDKKIPEQIQQKAKKIVDKNPKLRALKSASEGEKSMFNSTSWHGGKGSAPRPGTFSQEYKDNYDQIDWSKGREKKKSYKTKINGVYVDDEEKDV